MKLLVLAGTDDARQVVSALAGETRLRLTVSLPRPERQPQSYGVPVRIGGFGGDEGFETWMADQKIDAVLDATHAFAVNVSHRAAEYCARHDLPYLKFLRRSWLPGPGDRWTFVHDEADAARRIPYGVSVFVSTGRESLSSFKILTSQYVVCRVFDQPSERFPLPNGRWLPSRPPSDIASETRLLRELAADWLIARNTGGAAERIEVEAARNAGLEVAMIRRPLQPEAPRVETVADALAWVRRKL